MPFSEALSIFSYFSIWRVPILFCIAIKQGVFKRREHFEFISHLTFLPLISFLHLFCIVPALLYGGETKSFAKVLGLWARKAMCWALGKDV